MAKDDPIFTSMGMFIIDENQYPPSSKKEPVHNIIGGGGTYAIIGSRIIAGAEKSKLICGIIDKGSDFPEIVEEEILSWNSGIVWKEDLSRLTTRGLNIYDEADIRHFKYKTDKKRIEAQDIVNHPYLIRSRTIHIISSVERCESIIDTILSNTPNDVIPTFIYEPLPDVCVASSYDKLTLLLPKIDVFTPNLNEMSNLANLARVPETMEDIKTLSSKFSPYLTKPNSGSVVRCGPLGCFIKTSKVEISLPAYHRNQDKVVDVTGGGNLFCGGFVTGLCLSKGDWVIGGICGNIASGCVIERLGMPRLYLGLSDEKWNGSSTSKRLKYYVDMNKSILDGTFDVTKIDWLA